LQLFKHYKGMMFCSLCSILLEQLKGCGSPDIFIKNYYNG